MRKRTAAVLAVVSAAILCTAVLAAGGLQIGGYSVSGNAITVSIHNSSDQGQSGTIWAQVLHEGQVHTSRASVTAPAGQTVSATIVVGTITDDIDPFDRIALSIGDGPDPFPW